MAKFRYSVNSRDSLDFEHKDGDTLRDILKEALKQKKLPLNETTEKFFVIFIDGKRVDKEFWDVVKPTQEQEVIISVVPKDDVLAPVLGAVLLLTGIVITGGGLSVFAGAGWATVGNAAIGIGASLLLGALVKQPGDLTGGSPDYDESQMFSFSSQSNRLKKYQGVPRVYGTHRMFPVVAANAYTELENDPVTNELVQFYYAIYDFGYGPLDISDLRIGDTSIDDFNFVDYQLVDLNRPTVSEGPWDDSHNNTFNWYRGDVTQTEANGVLNVNQEDGGATPDQYQVVRNGAANSSNVDQEITITMVAPQGLVSLNSAGSRGTRTIELKIEFAEENTEDWRDFDDLDYVYSYIDPYDEQYVKITKNPGWSLPFKSIFYLDGQNIPYDIWANSAGLDSGFFEPNGSNYSYYKRKYKTRSGDNYIYLNTSLSAETPLKLNGVYIGKVQSVIPLTGEWAHRLTDVPANVDTGWYEYFKVDNNSLSVTSYFGNYLGIIDGLPYPSFQVDPRISNLKANAFKSGNTKIEAAKQKPVYAVYKFNPITKNRVKVRVTRIRSYSPVGFTAQVIDNLQWQQITTRLDATPIVTDQRHTFLEVRIKATDQLNGAIQKLSGIAKSYLEVYDQGTDTWNRELTNNPAWVFADLLTGTANKRALDKSRLDTDSLLEWAAFSDEVPTAPVSYGTFLKPRFETNFILDYSTTLANVLDSVASGAQASLNMYNGKYGVLIDKERNTPVQIFTPRNSFGFNATRNYVKPSHALKIKYVDPGSNWEQKERIVYNDGYDSETALTFEELQTFACTNNEQAWRFGRYHQAQQKLRQEVFTINVDFEHLICTRGDFVLITQDVMKLGGTPARVKEQVTATRVRIDDEVITVGGTSYGYTYRDSLGEIKTSTLTVISPDTFELDGDIPAVGDLFIFGEVGSITFECIVKSILPNDDLSAELQLVEKNNAIFDAESTDNIPDYDPQISSVEDINLTAPGPVTNLTVDENTFDCNGRSYVYYVDLSWDAPIGSIYETFEVYVNNGSGFKLTDYTGETEYRYTVDPTFLEVEHSFKILAVNSAGVKITLAETTSVEATPLNKTTPPSDIDGLFINILNETLQLDWEAISDCDVENYLIRFSPQLNARWDNSTPILTVDRNNSQASIPARTGTYLIKARDFNQNESENAATAITSIPELVNLNVIEETNDFPTFPGSLEQVESVSDALLLSEEVAGGPGVVEYYSEGNYYYDSFLDLGDIYTVRLQSLVEAEGYSKDDLMSNWTTLAAVPSLSVTDASEWGVETYYRGTDSFNVMSDWTTLQSINSLSEGAPDQWTTWRKFTIGDFTARIFQFRLRLISNKADVTPRVFDAKIKSDMPDRIESGDNINISALGLRINYPVEFKGPSPSPAVNITIDNAQSGDYPVITNKDLAGFDVVINDSTNTPVARQIDYVAKGYGRKQTATI